MPPESLSSIFFNWSPEAVIAVFTAIGTLIGGGVVWLSGVGLDRYMKWREFRLKEKERLQKLNLGKPLDMKEQLWEDKNLAAGYRALLLSWDSRIQVLENSLALKSQETQKLHSAYLDCVQSHADEKTRAETFVLQLKQEHERCNRLEELCEKLRLKLLKGHPPGVDPNPSPLSE